MELTNWFNIIATAVLSSTFGGLIGGLVAWGGIRIRLDHLEKKMGRLSQSVVYKDICEKCREGSDNREKRIESDIAEIKNDLRLLVRGASLA